MSLSLAGQTIQSPEQISDLARLGIGFVVGGPQWLERAIDAAPPAYSFDSENALADAIQQGLHGDRFALLPGLGLMVSPVKLISIGEQDLQALWAAETQQQGVGAVPGILQKHALLTQVDLDRAEAVLSAAGVEAEAVFQLKTFHDRAAIHRLSEVAGMSAAPAIEAGGFAVNAARTITEFCDYYRIYLKLAGEGPPAGQQPAANRLGQAKTTVDALTPLMFGALDCPVVGSSFTPDQATTVLASWIAQGRTLGFARVSAGIRQIVEHTGFTPDQAVDAESYVHGYLAASSQFLQSASLYETLMGQDGATYRFLLRGGGLQAVVALGPSRMLSLESFEQNAGA